MINEDSNYILVALNYNCNNKCKGCMIGDLKHKLKPIRMDEFEEIVRKESKDYNKIILSGAEITLNENIIQYINCAKKYFDTIRIQTNGRMLKNKEFCKKLINEGVNEFFITLNGHINKIHDSYTQIKGSFEETIKGLKNLSEFDIKTITNTVVTKNNVNHLTEIIELINTLHIKEIEIWNYLPMSNNDQNNLIIKNEVMLPKLIKALNKCDQYNIKTTIKYFPKCLLKNHKYKLNNKQPKTIIDSRYWEKLKSNEFYCKFMNKCKTKGCYGLTKAYINKYDWDDNIKPL